MSEIRKNHTKDILLGLFITVVGGIIVVKYEHNAFDDKKNEGQVATINQLGKKDVSTPVDIKSSTPSFSIPENWSTEFEVTENEDEFIEPTTKVRVFCNFASNGSQYAELRVILSTGENHNVGTLRRGEEFKFKYLDKKFRIYLVKVINGEPHDTAILKLERLP